MRDIHPENILKRPILAVFHVLMCKSALLLLSFVVSISSIAPKFLRLNQLYTEHLDLRHLDIWTWSAYVVNLSPSILLPPSPGGPISRYNRRDKILPHIQMCNTWEVNMHWHFCHISVELPLNQWSWNTQDNFFYMHWIRHFTKWERYTFLLPPVQLLMMWSTVTRKDFFDPNIWQIQHRHRWTESGTLCWRRPTCGVWCWLHLLLEWTESQRSMCPVAGVGFVVRISLIKKLSDHPKGRLMTLRIPLTSQHYATITSTYAPTMTGPDEVKGMFYEDQNNLFTNVPDQDKLLLT